MILLKKNDIINYKDQRGEEYVTRKRIRIIV